MLRIYNRLIELGILTAEEGLEAIDTGRLPDKEMSLKSQEEFKELREQGLYEPLIGGKNQAEIKKDAGRPEGGPAPTPEQNPAGQGEQSNAVNYSLTKVTDNLTKASKLFKTVEASLRKKHKIKRLNKEQKQVAEDIACIIIANENPESWDKKVSQYVRKPIDTNHDRIAEVREVAFEHQVDDYLASILLASKA